MKPVYFDFESDFVDTFRCIPMIVRYKLDVAGKKLQLAEWSRLTPGEKETLAEMPCTSPEEAARYRTYVEARVWERSQKTVKDLPQVLDSWNKTDQVPDEVLSKAAEWACSAPTLSQWRSLSKMQRFALVKLSRSGHEGENFPKALREFGLE